MTIEFITQTKATTSFTTSNKLKLQHIFVWPQAQHYGHAAFTDIKFI